MIRIFFILRGFVVVCESRDFLKVGKCFLWECMKVGVWCVKWGKDGKLIY